MSYVKPTIPALLCFYLCSAMPAAAAGPDLNELLSPPAKGALPSKSSASRPCWSFNELNTLIRDGQIGKADARGELPARLADIRAEYYRRGGRDHSSTQWVFPVAGYDVGAIDKGRNHGFVPSGYDFFSGNRHGGHPAYDIFIRDRDQDCLDDRSSKAVAVVSMTGGIVVAFEKEWQQGSGLRGGKYLWVYDPANDLLVYYAHNGELFVEPGTIVKPGDLLATVGRSGLNAAKKRSPTHLHFSALRIKNAQPLPERIYRALQLAVSVPAGGPK